MKKVQPRNLAGMMELLPEEQIQFNQIKDVIQSTYEKYGFLPLDTPVLELSDVLLAKAGGETEKQIYRFNKGDADICLRFDLTVPLAKYVSANENALEFPFKRYQIGKSYRGEKPQKGRYREFYQCDVDIVGRELSVKNDAELPAIIYDIFKQLDFGKFTICLNNRKVINGLFDAFGLADKKEDVMRTIDKYDKIGAENVRAVLVEDYQIDAQVVEKLIRFLTFTGSNDEIIAMLKNSQIDTPAFVEGVAELEQVVKYIRLQKVPEEYFQIRLTIVRGLDYYTGTVYETVLDDYRSLGSVCGGGRYDNLTSYYTDQNIQGVGVSIGLTRLFYQLKEANLIKSAKTSIADVLLLPMDDIADEKCFNIAEKLRNANINCQVYLENKKFKNKLNYANKLQIPFVIIVGEDELNNGTVTLKDMFKFDQISVKDNELISVLKEKLQ